MRKIAIIGAGFDHPPELPSDVEVWTVGRIIDVLPRVDRAYEIHSPEIYTWYIDLLRRAISRGVRVYMRHPIDGAYPIGMNEIRLSSGFFYGTPPIMVAHAIKEKVDVIQIYGLPLTGDEYKRQRPSLLFHLGIAYGSGIRIEDHSSLIDWEADYGG